MTGAVSRTDRVLFVDGNYLEERYKHKMHALFANDGDLDYGQVRHSQAFGARVAARTTTTASTTNRGPKNRCRTCCARAVYGNAIRINRCCPRFPCTTRHRSAWEASRAKKVDILLAVDMLTHAHSHNMEHANPDRRRPGLPAIGRCRCEARRSGERLVRRALLRARALGSR